MPPRRDLICLGTLLVMTGVVFLFKTVELGIFSSSREEVSEIRFITNLEGEEEVELPCVNALLDKLEAERHHFNPEQYDMFRLFFKYGLTYQKQELYRYRQIAENRGFHIQSKEDLKARLEGAKCFPSPTDQIKRPNIGLCVQQHSNGPDIQEFISHYLLLGVSKIIIYDNSEPSSSESAYFRKVVQPFLDLGYVEVKQHLGENVFVEVFQRCYREHNNQFDWIANIDTDEYFVVSNNYEGSPCLTDILPQYEEFGGLVVNWRLISPAVGYQADHQVGLKKFKLAYNMPENRHIKTIYQTKYCTGVPQQHFVNYVGGKYAVNSHKRRCDSFFCDGDDLFDHFELYHFYGRDWEYTFLEKICSTTQRGHQMYVQNRINNFIPHLTGLQNRVPLSQNVHEDALQRFIFP